MSQTMEQMDNGSMREQDEPEKKQKSRRPPNTAFRQQRLKAWQPILTPKTVLPLFFAVGIIFAPIGGVLLWASAQVQEIIIDYSTCNTTAPACETIGGTPTPPQDAYIPDSKVTSYFKNTTERSDRPTWCRSTTSNAQTFVGARNLPNTAMCHVQFYLPVEIAPPILLYYQLTNFYQNHRRYVKSFDQDQLAGQAVSAKSINGSDCDPLKGEIRNGNFTPYYPCGLIANSLFNDTISKPVQVSTVGSAASNITYNFTSENTAWSSDADLYKMTSYSNSEVLPPPNWREAFPTYNDTFPIPDLHTNDHFQVWMRTAGLPTFSKLYLRNDNETMQIGRYQVDVYDYFPVLLYDGTKSILISTRTVMGGKNPFLGIAFVVVGGLCVILGALFTVTQLIKPRKLGDHSYLSWSSDQPSTATTTGRAPRPGEAA